MQLCMALVYYLDIASNFASVSQLENLSAFSFSPKSTSIKSIFNTRIVICKSPLQYFCYIHSIFFYR